MDRWGESGGISDENSGARLWRGCANAGSNMSRQASFAGVLQALLLAARDPECEVRLAAAISLGLQGDHRAIDTLVTLLQDEDEPIFSEPCWLARVRCPLSRAFCGGTTFWMELHGTTSFLPRAMRIDPGGFPRKSMLVSAQQRR